MKITDYLAQIKSTAISFEILPPLKGKSIQSIYDILDPLMEFKPPFIDVTYHREEYIYKKRDGGYFEKVAIRKRPGTVGICAAIMTRYKVEAVPHLICGGFTKEETENALIDLNFLGIQNVLVIRGDPAKPEIEFIPEVNGHTYAIQLLKQVVNMNKGIYIQEEIEDGLKTDFCIGVAGYPEKHYEAPNMESDLKYLKQKVDVGAQYIVTQMFFDNEKYFNFVKKCREIGINIPIIAGIKPITRKKQLQTLPRIFFMAIPQVLVEEIEKCKNNEEVVQVGIEWGAQQAKGLVQFGVPCLHFYTMGDLESVKAIASRVF